jgi:hypothetical protein
MCALLTHFQAQEIEERLLQCALVSKTGVETKKRPFLCLVRTGKSE